VTSLFLASLVFTTSYAGASSGHAPVRMPNVVGRSRAQLYSIMRHDALYFNTHGPGTSNGTWRTVAAQSPAPGKLVAWHSTVSITTSMRAYRGTRAVPRVIGLSKARVFAAMRKADLYFTTRGPGSAGGTWVVARRQSPAPGTLVAWHSTVIITTALTKARPKPVIKVVVKEKPKPKKPVTTTSTTSTTSTTTTSSTTTTTYPGEPTTSTTSTTSTTTTTLPTTTTTIKRSKSRDFRVGIATWYSYVPGRCATWYLPLGTRVTVRDLTTGRTVTCRATDREATHGDRVVDLSETQFAQLSPLWRGVIRVKVSW
jgi:beta-lactam-binding protein with PASTA domain